MKSRDEFGELARDLNLFLERVNQVMEDLSAVLSSISELTERLTDVHGRTVHRQHRLDELARDATRDVYEEAAAHSLLDLQWLETAESALRSLQQLAAPEALPAAESERLERLLGQFRELVAEAECTVARNREIGANLLDLNHELRASGETLQEMAVLEERMRSISSQGQTLLERLRGTGGNR